MKRRIIISILFMSVLLLNGMIAAGEDNNDPQKFFSAGNTYYEKGDYNNAVEYYLKAVNSGVESGSLYYNIGNAFFKLGKLGYAILYYEKAERLIPADADLRSNLEYARSLVGETYYPESSNVVIRLIKRPFKDINLNAMAMIGAFLYLILIALAAIGITRPEFGKKARIFFIAIAALFVFTVASFGIKYYDEEFLKHGIMVEKEVECRFEPIDKSNIYYKLKEGAEVYILKTRNDWRQIRRLDGKIAWVKKAAVGEI
ncbi:MAG: tetratricopeptide repeat protein [Candidatus Omnitrophica bacterium]|nr:tetratricopeptide repeat protein [Candidatus Omnitrophota bacterium]